MQTVDYIMKYSKLYAELVATDEVPDLTNYTLITNPSRRDMASQIELHMFWQIPLPLGLIGELEYYIEQGVFFTENLDVYYHVDEKYWPIVRYSTGAVLRCRKVRAYDFTYSLELYTKAPHHFNLTIYNYNSRECLSRVQVTGYIERVLNLECMRLLYSKGLDPVMLMYCAAREGLIDCLRFLRDRGYNLEHAIEGAFATDQVKCFKYIVYNTKIELDTSDIYSALTYGAFECVKYMHSLNIPCDGGVNRAIKGGNVKCLKYVLKNGGKTNWNSMDIAVKYDNVKCLAYLYKNGERLPPANKAAKKGRYKCLRYITMHTTRHFIAIQAAASVGDLRAIRLLHRLKVSWEHSLCIAIRYGHNKCVKYMYEHGARESTALECAIKHCNIPIVKYLLDKGEDWNAAIENCALEGDLASITLMHKFGAPWLEAMDFAASAGHIDCIKYMHSKGVPYGRALFTAVSCGQLDCVEYLVERGVDMADTLDEAIYKNELEIVEYLHEQGAHSEDPLEQLRSDASDSLISYVRRTILGLKK